MRRKLFTILPLVSLVVAATGCGALSGPSEAPPNTATATVTATETETDTATVAEPAPQPSTPPAPAPSTCGDLYGGWSTLDDSTDITMVRGDIYDVRIGRHECFDRIVIDVDTTEDVGFRAKYVSVVHQFGSGFDVPVAGEAALELVVDAPLAMSMYDNPPTAFTTTPTWETLREVKNAGSFEGITKLAIGVKSQVKFGVYHHTGPDGKTHVIVDLVHSF